MLGMIPADAFRLFAGLLVVAYCLVSLFGGLRIQVADKSPFRDGVIGLLGGISGGLASLSGPIVTVWCGLKGWTPDEQRATYQPYNFAILSAALVGFAVAGLITLQLAAYAAVSLPATLIGVWLGRACYGRIDAPLFRRIVLVLLTASGLVLIAQSVW